MVCNILANAADKTREFNNIGEAALYALLGFLMVFAGIAFLIFVVWLVGKIMSKTTGKKADKKVSETQAKAKEEDKTALARKSETEEITDETVAVITAAIMAYYQQNNPKCEFTVKRIKRI